jgi:spore coat protein U-like protein
VTAGVYTANYSTRDLFIEWAGYTTSPPDCGQRLPDSAEFSSLVTANVVGECTVSATDMDFGQVTSSIEARPIESIGVITMNCTNNLNYSHRDRCRPGFCSDGGHAHAYSPRQPLLVALQPVRRPPHRRTWGDGTLGTETVHDRGTGHAQTFTVHGQIPPQPNPPAGRLRRPGAGDRDVLSRAQLGWCTVRRIVPRTASFFDDGARCCRQPTFGERMNTTSTHDHARVARKLAAAPRPMARASSSPA